MSKSEVSGKQKGVKTQVKNKKDKTTSINDYKKREERRLKIKYDIALIITGLATLIVAIAQILFILNCK